MIKNEEEERKEKKSLKVRKIKPQPLFLMFRFGEKP